jgi:ribosomal protein S18 acetylase RimI-like enzyme
MKTEFRQAELPKELRSLMAFDRKVFSEADIFPSAYWKACESWWMLVDGVKAGCCAFQRNIDFREDLEEEGWNPARNGSLYIATTGLLPRYQGLGLGPLLKAWQLAYARRHGFHRIITNTRKRNRRMIELNRKFGFRILRTTPGYYAEPSDATVVMEILLPKARTAPKKA